MTQPPDPYARPGGAEPHDPYVSPPWADEAGYARQSSPSPADGAPAPDALYQWAVPRGPRYFVGVGGYRQAVLVLGGLWLAGEWLRAWTAFFATFGPAGTEPDAWVLAAYDIASGSSLVGLVAAVVSVIWLHRAYQNAAAAAPGALRRSEAWVWLGWAVPVVNLWFPKQIVDDATSATARAAGLPRGSDTLTWWVSWVLFDTLHRAELVLYQDGSSASAGVIRPELHFATAIAGTIAFALWVPIVQRLSDLQDALAGRPAPGPLEAGPRIY